jgi:hypothetical protein
MRCIMGFCFVLVASSVAWANESNLAPQQSAPPPPAVRTSVPNIQAPAADAVASPSTTVQPGTALAPTTTSDGSTVVAQPGAMASNPAGNAPHYYYYPAGYNGMTYGTTVPGRYYYSTGYTPYYSTSYAPAYTTPTQTYYTTVRRGPFGLFRRRFVQPMAYTTTAAMTPSYYTGPSYYSTPTTYAVPPMTAPAATATSGVNPPGTAAPAYTPTTFTVPNEALPAASTPPSGTTPSDTAPPPPPPGAASSSGSIPSRTIPPPPAVNPK